MENLILLVQLFTYESGTGSTGYGNAGAFSSVNYGSVSTPSIANGDIVGCALDISSASGTLTLKMVLHWVQLLLHMTK